MSSHELQLHQSFPFAEPTAPGMYTGYSPELRAGVIGAGKVGMSIALALHARGHLAWIVARSEQRRSEARMAFPSVPVFASGADIDSLPDWIAICTPDAQIAAAAAELGTSALWESHTQHSPCVLVTHCSGALHSNELQPVIRTGVLTAAMHPFQTFPYVSERLIHGIAWGIECSEQSPPECAQRAAHAVRCVGGTPVILGPETVQRKEIYHSVAVVASNYLTAVAAVARQAAHAAKISPTDFLQPIMRTAMENASMWIARDSAPPLTGPIARGDVQTVRKHVDAMEQAGEHELLRAYVLMGLVTADYAARTKLIDASVYNELRVYLEGALTRQS